MKRECGLPSSGTLGAALRKTPPTAALNCKCLDRCHLPVGRRTGHSGLLAWPHSAALPRIRGRARGAACEALSHLAGRTPLLGTLSQQRLPCLRTRRSGFLDDLCPRPGFRTHRLLVRPMALSAAFSRRRCVRHYHRSPHGQSGWLTSSPGMRFAGTVAPTTFMSASGCSSAARK
jgi:hypothetical protein